MSAFPQLFLLGQNEKRLRCLPVSSRGSRQLSSTNISPVSSHGLGRGWWGAPSVYTARVLLRCLSGHPVRANSKRTVADTSSHSGERSPAVAFCSLSACCFCCSYFLSSEHRCCWAELLWAVGRGSYWDAAALVLASDGRLIYVFLMSTMLLASDMLCFTPWFLMNQNIENSRIQIHWFFFIIIFFNSIKWREIKLLYTNAFIKMITKML